MADLVWLDRSGIVAVSGYSVMLGDTAVSPESAI